MLALGLALMSAPECRGLLALTTPEDRRLARRHRRPLRRAQSLVARGLVRSLLHRETGVPPGTWQLLVEPSGRPSAREGATGRRVEISVSHSRAAVAVAVSEHGTVGIDIEFIDPSRPAMALAQAAFGSREAAAVAAQGARAFFRLWTLREARAKAECGGFAAIFDDIDRFADTPELGVWSEQSRGTPWVFAHIRPFPGYACSIALRV
jgi:4'-phosphopantetheinyl transferase